MLVSQDLLLGDTCSAADIICGYDLGLLFGKYNLVKCPAAQEYLSRLLARPAAISFAKAIG